MIFCLSSCICVNLFADSSQYLTLTLVRANLSRIKRVEIVIPKGCLGLFGFSAESQQGLFVVLLETIA